MQTPQASLRVGIGQCSLAGIKPVNEDFFGVVTPEEPALHTKGIAAVIADGVSACENGREASEYCAKGFLSDYYATPDSWSVKTSSERVLNAINRWMCRHGDGRTVELASTLSVVVLKSNTAHVFHIGDSRIYHLRGEVMEQITRDHSRLVGAKKSYLMRAMGFDPKLEIDHKTVDLEVGDFLIMTTDGIHDVLPDRELRNLIEQHTADLADAAQAMVEAALKAGSQDNLTCQILRIESLPDPDGIETYNRLAALVMPPPLEAGMSLDGYRIVGELSSSSRSQLYLAVDTRSAGEIPVVIKTPSVNYEDDAAYLERFLHEEWASNRINSPFVVRSYDPGRRKSCLYLAMEYVEGESLRAWMNRNPNPSIPTVVSHMEQIAKGLQVLHRQEMVHQDLKPENIMVQPDGQFRIIDLGATKIAGLEEAEKVISQPTGLGTANYMAPECLLGQGSSVRSDIFSLGVIAYELLTGERPFGEHELRRAKWRDFDSQSYRPSPHFNPMVPMWLDGALKKALAADPRERYGELSEFIYDLKHPNPRFLSQSLPPLLERNPSGFWRALAAALLVTNLLFLYLLVR